MGAFGSQRPYRIGALLLYLENHPGSAEIAPDFSHAQNLPHNGLMAVLFAVIAVLIYIGGLMCSHKGAFRIATNLRLQTMEHIVKLPLGFAEQFGSGRLRKIVNESSAATETYLAHQLPDRANAIATPCGLSSCCWCSTGGWGF